MSPQQWARESLDFWDKERERHKQIITPFWENKRSYKESFEHFCSRDKYLNYIQKVEDTIIWLLVDNSDNKTDQNPYF